jgi:2-C-methyl-D-erythritol 4-phosphate cytidylyltransferase
MNIAVILAGGSGSRLGGGLPKQFLKVAGKKIIEHTIDVFENNSLIDEIAIVTKEEYISEVENMILHNKYTKVKKILVGGKERYHSSLSAIEAYSKNDDILLFHDAVRPLVNDRIINDCIDAMKQYNAVDVAIKATDTMIEVNSDNCIEYIPDRAKLRNGQTPQCFRRELIKKAYDKALNDPNFITTDDCGVVRKYLPNEPIGVVRGENFNMKVTYIEDLFLLDKLFQLKSIEVNDNELNESTKKGLSGKIVVVFGGSYGIGEEIVKIASKFGAYVYSFSRSLNGVDVRDAIKIHEELEKIYVERGHIDYVVCTAGLLQKEPFATMSYEDIQKCIDVNLMGVINVAKESYPYLRKSCGALLFYTSSSYTRGRMMYSIYSSTKAAIVNFTQALSEEWFYDNVRVNCINPERCNTPMRRSNFGIEPIETLLTPDKVAVVSLNTLVSKFTGEVIDVKIKREDEKGK